MTDNLASDVATHKSIPLLVHDQNLSLQIQESIPSSPVLSWEPFQSVNTRGRANQLCLRQTMVWFIFLSPKGIGLPFQGLQYNTAVLIKTE